MAIGACVDRMREDALHSGARRMAPLQITAIGSAMRTHAHTDAVSHQIPDHAPHAADAVELVEDPQGNFSNSFLPPEEREPGVEGLFHPGAEQEAAALIRHTAYSGIDLVPTGAAQAADRGIPGEGRRRCRQPRQAPLPLRTVWPAGPAAHRGSGPYVAGRGGIEGLYGFTLIAVQAH